VIRSAIRKTTYVTDTDRETCGMGRFRPIDEVGWDKDKIHGVKEDIGAGRNDWVGVDPDWNVWTGSHTGEAINHGQWK